MGRERGLVLPTKKRSYLGGETSEDETFSVDNMPIAGDL